MLFCGRSVHYILYIGAELSIIFYSLSCTQLFTLHFFSCVGMHTMLYFANIVLSFQIKKTFS